jgi:type I restriction enzyme M protein
VVLDTGAVSRGSGNQGTNKEKDIRKAFVEKDWIEAVVLMPENLFYNTTAPGIILVLNKNKAKERKGKILLLNASQEFEKGRPKNFIPDEKIKKIANSFREFRDVERFSRIVSVDEVLKNDYNLSPSRYVETGAGEVYKDIPSLLTELEKLEEEGKRIDAELSTVFEQLGFKTEEATKK